MPKDYPSFTEFNDAVGRISALEKDLEKTIDQTNRAFNSAKTSDGGLTKRLDGLETRMDQTRDHLNQILQKAKDYDAGLSKRIDALETRMDQTRDHLNQILQKAKDYDSGLDRRVSSVESSMKDIEREKRSSSNAETLSKRDVTAMVETSARELERDLTKQIGDLRRQLDTLSRSNKR